MNIDLSGKRALICGSTSGIGLACARLMAAAGAQVTLLGRSEKGLAAALAQLPALPTGAGGAGRGHGTILADLAKPDEAAAAVAKALDPARPFHILINNTGGPPAGSAIDADPAALLAAFNAQLLSAHALVRLLLPGFKASGGAKGGYGRVINITSTSVKVPIPNLAISNIIRPAVAAWGKCLATELGPWGITVNNILPGYTATDRLDSIMKNRAAKQSISEDQVRKETIAATPAGRFGQPDEIAAAALFLASPLAGYINGINLPVDGGRLGPL